MAGEIIRKGDPTSHHGIVLEGSLMDICMGQPIAFIGHKVHCPKCKGDFPIVEGVMTTTFYGKGVAVAGMKTSCGAILIATQFTDTVEWSVGASGSSSATTAAKAAAAAVMNVKVSKPGPDAKPFDEQFVLFNEEESVLAEMPYTVKLPSGELVRGITDIEGRTERYVTDVAQPIEIYLGHHIA
ncbi:PAAR domain-containing protein [Janthinobacterium rivuli]|uniref:PAAR domain-containing protein n=1 Tax=Janthinobacterium sp. FT68W TaxID=2654255 RepID=UPI00126442EF|nr:PAAR domain-containing protein [Janthinobacterium sp. FT68W]KAB8052613.1 PAAR domain-containing protein [Janthinobacterium sp. FT68W]